MGFRCRVVFTLVSIGLTGACLGPQTDVSSLTEQAQTASPTAANLTYPAQVCGRDGFNFIYTNYFRVSCQGCHSQGGIGDLAFADPDPDLAFNALQYYGKIYFMPFVENNQFCGSSCSLAPGSPMDNAVSEWLDNRDSCPSS